MNNNVILVEDSDFFICKAFSEIITAGNLLEIKLGNEARPAIANHFAQLSPEDYQDMAVLANRITAFSQRTGNESLNEWLGEIYDQLDESGIEKILKKIGDPGDEADAEPQIRRNITNEARDICKDIESWAKQERDNNQSDQNDSNSN